MASHSVESGSREGFDTVMLASAEGEIEATFVPPLNMVGCSLRHRGDELLDDCGGLAVYAQERGTMGIPLLHPWINRLSERRFEVAGRLVDVDATAGLVSADPNGLPIHGLTAASPLWEVTEKEANDEGAQLAARLDWTSHDELMACFPFSHRLEMRASLRGATLTIATTLTSTGDHPVPVSFGFHPYFRLPGVPREQWLVSMPLRSHVVVDDSLIPTGEREPIEILAGALGDRTYDDGYDELAKPARFDLSGGGRRLTVGFAEGYPIAVVWAPGGRELICFEPMTARTNALVTQGEGLPLVEPGGAYRAVFSITVSPTDGK